MTLAKQKALESELQKALAECARLREENGRLRALLGLSTELGAETQLGMPTQLRLPVESDLLGEPRLPSEPGPPLEGLEPSLPPHSLEPSAPEIVSTNSPAELKIVKFRSLFRGREDVYAIRWPGSSPPGKSILSSWFTAGNCSTSGGNVSQRFSACLSRPSARSAAARLSPPASSTSG